MMTRNEFGRCVRSLCPPGYTAHDAVQAYLFRQHQDDRVNTIILSYKDYATSFYLYPPSATIRFAAVESVMDRLFHETGIENVYGGDATIARSFVGVAGVDDRAFDTEVGDPVSFEVVAVILRTIVQGSVLPFFAAHQTLQDVVATTETMDLASMVKLVQQPLPLRRMVIKKLANDPAYFEYYRTVLDYYRAQHSDDDVKLASHLHQLLQRAI